MNYPRAKTPRIALVSMPWAPYGSPLVATGLLKSILVNHGYDCRVLHLSVEFYKALGRCLEGNLEFRVKEIAASMYSQLYDWLFARKAFGIEKSDYLETYSEDPIYADVRQDFELLIDKISQQEHWKTFDLIGFSCGFFQTISSLALAKEIKRHNPTIPIVLGGAALDQDVAEQILKNTDWIDTIIVGEAELTFPNAISNILDRKCKLIISPPLTIAEFNNQPFPNYDEFFEENDTARVTMEVSRGCWYKPICSFCGMMPNSSYKYKKDMLPEVTYLKNRYDISDIQVVDLVFPTAGFRLFDQTPGLGVDFMYSLRVDSIKPQNVRQIKSLRQGGTKTVFIGIESLHPELLKMMNKGHLAINAISLLKWMKFYDIRIEWCLLFGVPGENSHHYNELLIVLKKITHLHAPRTQRIFFSRNSPYFYQFQEELKPVKSCLYLYPPTFDIKAMAWTFDRINIKHIKNQILNAPSIRSVINFIKIWRRSNESLTQIGNTIIDRRLDQLQKYNLSNEETSLADYCSIPKLKKDVEEKFSSNSIQQMIKNNLIIYLDQRYLSLIEPQTELTCDIPLSEENQNVYQESVEIKSHVQDDILSLKVL